MAQQYYYFIAGLPELALDETKLSVSLASFKEEVRTHVSDADFELVKFLFLPYDNRNLINLLLGRENRFDTLGNYSQEYWEENLKKPQGLPAYLQRFLTAYNSETPIYGQYSWENQLTWLFYQEAINHSNGFLREWYTFDLHLKNILAALNCRKHGFNPEEEILGEDELATAFKKSSSADFGLGRTLPYLDKLVHIFDNANQQEREKNIDALRWGFVEQNLFFQYFSIEKILGYLIRLRIAERWLRLDGETGRARLKQIYADLASGFKFPEIFNIKEGKKV